MVNIEDYKQTIDSLLNDLPERTQDVLCRRFGFPGKRETLEAIGTNYNITRERVRQIENKGIDAIQKDQKFSNLKDSFLDIKKFIDLNGGLKKEDVLETTLTPSLKERPYLLFLLKIGEPFFYHPDSPELYSLWKTKNEALDYANHVSDFLVKKMEKEERVFSEDEIIDISKKEIPQRIRIKLPKDYIVSYIEVTKKIEKNPFGEYGPSHWKEVNPKGIRDEAYIVLKREKTPLHFKELAKIIEQNLQKSVHENTLHNELIKNDNFVLIGRGIYALKEWGYQNGTVKDVIENILKQGSSPVSKEELIDKVKEQRLVKDATIALNLQHFKKTSEGNYIL
jgi:hypothetical protein